MLNLHVVAKCLVVDEVVVWLAMHEARLFAEPSCLNVLLMIAFAFDCRLAFCVLRGLLA